MKVWPPDCPECYGSGYIYDADHPMWSPVPCDTCIYHEQTEESQTEKGNK